jgi:hypothetical protein
MRAIAIIAIVSCITQAGPALAQSNQSAGSQGQSNSAAGTNPSAPGQARTYKPGEAGSAKWRKDTGVQGTSGAPGGAGGQGTGSSSSQGLAGSGSAKPTQGQ